MLSLLAQSQTIFDIPPDQFYSLLFWLCRTIVIHLFLAMITGVFYRL